jgi:hypothetical protein
MMEQEDRTVSEKGPMAGTCELGNEPFGFHKSRDFLEQIKKYQFCYEDPAHGVS